MDSPLSGGPIQGYHMVSGTLALLKYLLIYVNGKQGSGPDRGRSPVEWGEIPSDCLVSQGLAWTSQGLDLTFQSLV